MSTTDFVKGACGRCGGHLEFPAAAAGSTVSCPHCGQPTELAAPAEISGGSGRKLFIIASVALVALAMFAAGFIYLKKPAEVLAEKKSAAAEPAEKIPAPPDAVTTNDFAIASFALEKKPGGSLVYVTGKLRNLREQQRFGVKLEFALFDRDEKPVGTAKDYLPVLEPGGGWSFKAMVLESKAASAKFGSVREDQ